MIVASGRSGRGPHDRQQAARTFPGRGARLAAGDPGLTPPRRRDAAGRPAGAATTGRSHARIHAGDHSVLAAGGPVGADGVGPVAGAALGGVLGCRRGIPACQSARRDARPTAASAATPPHPRGPPDVAYGRGAGRGGRAGGAWPPGPPGCCGSFSLPSSRCCWCGLRLIPVPGGENSPACVASGWPDPHDRAGAVRGGAGSDEVETHSASHAWSDHR